jgi:hypothetical protein
MTTMLVVCVGCSRHVRSTDARCPFCAALVVAGDAPSLELPRGASRAALVALGASLSLTGCERGAALANPPPRADAYVEAHPAIVAPYGAPPRPRPPLPPAVALLTWHITLSDGIRMGARSTTRLEISATNNSPGVVQPERDRLRLLVNGVPSRVFDLAFGNGVRVSEWSDLPAGRTVRDARMIVEALMPAPGEYRLVLEWDGHVVARRTVSVVP